MPNYSSEQQLIDRYFSRHQSACDSVEVGVGDDAAIVKPPSHSKLYITTDTLNVDVHFFADCKAEYVGHKSLAVNLSDIAAMGAIPLWATLSLSLPEIDHAWLDGFSNGLYRLAELHNVKLVGGDLVKGPLSITIQVTGCTDKNTALLRSGCQTDDLIYVSGHLGDAAMGLNILKNNLKIKLTKNEEKHFLDKLHTPSPRFDVSTPITKYATSAIDISDGLLIDLQRMLTMSNKAATIDIEKIPVSAEMQRHINDTSDIDNVLVAAEDYELIFTINALDKPRLEQYFSSENILVTQIGSINEGSGKENSGITLLHKGQEYTLPTVAGFDHFS